ARMVAVIAAMRGKVEGNGKTLLTGGEIAAVEGVGFLGCRESGILPDRPGLVDVHGRVGAADEGRQAGKRVEIRQPLEIRVVIGALDGDALRRLPFRVAAGHGGSGRLRPCNAGELRDHAAAPISSSMRRTGRRSHRAAASCAISAGVASSVL